MSNRIPISKKGHAKGEDGYKTFSIRAKEATVFALDEIARDSNRSRNDLINMLLEYGVAHCDIID